MDQFSCSPSAGTAGIRWPWVVETQKPLEQGRTETKACKLARGRCQLTLGEMFWLRELSNKGPRGNKLPVTGCVQTKPGNSGQRWHGGRRAFDVVEGPALSKSKSNVLPMLSLCFCERQRENCCSYFPLKPNTLQVPGPCWRQRNNRKPPEFQSLSLRPLSNPCRARGRVSLGGRFKIIISLCYSLNWNWFVQRERGSLGSTLPTPLTSGGGKMASNPSGQKPCIGQRSNLTLSLLMCSVHIDVFCLSWNCFSPSILFFPNCLHFKRDA